MKKTLSVFLAALVLCSSAMADKEEDVFFSPKRFSVKKEIVEKLSTDSPAPGELDRFAEEFTGGVELVASGDNSKAKSVLFHARELWPEYFGTDFVLALSFEMSGDYVSAAKFYKSYLRKLRNYHAGKYHISGALIRFLSGGNVEKYDEAKDRVYSRMAAHGIMVDKVTEAGGSPFIPIAILGLIAAIAVFYWLDRHIIPYVKRRIRILTPPKGFWACRHCGGYSPEVSNFCLRCGVTRK
jgi:hypothetical protein